MILVRLVQLLSIVLLLLITLPFASPQLTPSFGFWLMQSLPLFLILPRLPHLKATQWLAFVTLFYFTVAVLEISAAQSILELSLACLMLLSCLILFITAIVIIRKYYS